MGDAHKSCITCVQVDNNSNNSIIISGGADGRIVIW